MRIKRLSDRDLQMNQQAAAVAAAVLAQPVEAATRCEQRSTKATQIYPSGGEVWSRQIPNGSGLPKSFILAVTRTHIFALEDKQHRGRLVPGGVIKVWDREGFRAMRGADAMAAAAGLPDDRQTVTLWLPIDGDSGRVAQAIAQQRAAAGQRIPGLPHMFMVGKDAASQRVLQVLGATTPGQITGGPNIVIGGQRLEEIIAQGGMPAGAANITIGGQRLQDMIAQAAPPSAAPVAGSAPQPQSTAQRLQELETLRTTGAITETEYNRKREQIIAEL
jgi:hypothetical protein